jgi:hypothetical protein
MNCPALAEFDDTFLDGLYFCNRTYALFETIRGRPDGVSRLRRKPSKLEKKLLEELLPIAKYVQASYASNHKASKATKSRLHSQRQY